jgi:hypothetical protein
MSLLTLAAATLLTISVNGIAQPPTVLPVNEQECSRKALEIMLDAPRRGPVVTADCKVLVADEPSKPASQPAPPKQKE